MLTINSQLQIMCNNWSKNICVCRLQFNNNYKNPDDFKKDCNGFSNYSECVWYCNDHDKKRDKNMQF